MKKAVNMFEATMRACQQVKKENFEAGRRAATKNTAKASKSIKESNKRTSKKRRVESTQYTEDDDIEDQVADDVSDDVIVVTDPDLNVDDYEDHLDDLQDIVDDTPEGEDPVDDQYVDEQVYACPVCGNNFFSEDDMSDGGTCPVCGEDADAFVLIGKVADPDDTADTDDEEDLEVDAGSDEPDDTDDEDLDLECDDRGMSHRRVESYRYSINESRMNSFLTKFIKENYKNAKSMNLTGARIKGSKLTLECVIRMNGGKSKKVNLVAENFHPVVKTPFKILVKLDKAFKVESKKGQSDIQFMAFVEGKDIKVSSMNYKFNTLKEGKRYEVSNKYILKESKRPTTKKRMSKVRK